MTPRAWIPALLLTALSAFADVSPELTKAIEQFKQKNYDAAAAALQALDKQTPNTPEVLYYLGMTERKQKHYEDAVRHLEKATELSPNNSAYFLALGDAYGSIAKETRSFGAAQRTGQAFETAVKLDPKSEEARASLIDFCRKAPPIVGGGMKRAYAQAKELQALDPIAGARLLVSLYRGDKRDEDAFAVCNDTLKEHPHDYSLLYLIGRMAVETGTHTMDGVQALEECLTLPAPEGFPTHTSANIRLGQLYSKIGDFPSARKRFEQALKDDPTNADAKAGLDSLDATAAANTPPPTASSASPETKEKTKSASTPASPEKDALPPK
ncbi:MAG TPA: tetratricopeptide repeat protein [Opitutaceae bacterium]|nr:tetratricopeptide repeat protein [Opitutaceae bacterium]